MYAVGRSGLNVFTSTGDVDGVTAPVGFASVYVGAVGDEVKVMIELNGGLLLRFVKLLAWFGL